MAREADQNNSGRSVKWTGKQPQGVAVNMHKVYRTGASRTESEDAALTKAQVEQKPR
jgi:hypothetical protein